MQKAFYNLTDSDYKRRQSTSRPYMKSHISVTARKIAAHIAGVVKS